MRIAILIAFLTLGAPALSSADVVNRTVDGLKITYYEFGSGTQKEMLKGGYDIKVEGDTAKQINTVKDLDGNVVGTEELVEKNGSFHSYGYQRVNADEGGKVVLEGDTLHFTYTKGGKTKTSTEKLPERFVVGAGLTSYLRDKWDEVLDGKEVHIKYGVVDRRDIFRFKLFKERIETRNGEEVVIVKMKPATFFVSLLVKPIIFTFSMDGSKVYEIEGRTFLFGKVGAKWKPLDAHTVFNHE